MTGQEKKRQNKIIKAIEGTKVEFYWDQRDELSTEQVVQVLEDGFSSVMDNIMEYNFEQVWELEREGRREALEEFEDEENDIEDLMEEFEDVYPEVDMNWKDLFNNSKATAVIKLFSNYDCINSHWYESQGGYDYEESYFGAMVDFLNLNPYKVKQLLTKQGIDTNGKWKNLKSRNGKELVDYEEFWIELENQCCPASLLTIPVSINLADMYENQTTLEATKSIKLKKGTRVGIYSNFNGGGSPFDMQLIQDVTIHLGKIGPSDFDKVELRAEDGYTIKDCYGVTDDFYQEINV